MTDVSQFPLLEDRDVPYYVQIYDIIYSFIRDGRLVPGDHIPGENILASHWKVSRSTIRIAVRRLEEDGYIYKTQGKRAMVTDQLARMAKSLGKLSNPCITGCVEEITRREVSISVQDGGTLLSDMTDVESGYFISLAVFVRYYVHDEHVASSITLIPIREFEQFGISIEDTKGIEDLVLYQIYHKAEHTHMSLNVMENTEKEEDKPQGAALLVMCEVLKNGEHPISYHKYWMEGNWYRFTIERRG